MAEESNEPAGPPADAAPSDGQFPPPMAPPADAPPSQPTSQEMGTPAFDPPAQPEPQADPAPQAPASPEAKIPYTPQPEESGSSAEVTKIVGDLGCLTTESGDRLKLRLGKNTIGRQATDLIINDRTISRQHCVIEAVANRSNTVDYFIYDIGHDSGKSSSNGVFLSGRTQRLEDFERIQLANGSAVHIGNVRLVLTF